MKRTLILIGSLLFIGCGGDSQSVENNVSSNNSNIEYLKANHTHYSEHGSTQTPVPTKDENAKRIHWTITAMTEEAAMKLEGHLTYMEEKLLNDKNPRPWDKLFVMEAYMKFNKHYTSSVERSGHNVTITKSATTTCAYEVISAHSDVVSADFFGRGDIDVDNSSKAESILASSSCDEERASIEQYLSERHKVRGKNQ